eukprot:scaffold263372_cov31-Attheya_sp.AAC.1
MRVLIFRSVLGLVARLVGWVVFHPQKWVAHPQNFASLVHPQKLGMVLGAVQAYCFWCDVGVLGVPNAGWHTDFVSFL